MKAKLSKDKGKGKATKEVKSPTAIFAGFAHPTGNNDVQARGSATEADFGIKAPVKDGVAASTADAGASKPLVPTAVPSTPAKIDESKVNPNEPNTCKGATSTDPNDKKAEDDGNKSMGEEDHPVGDTGGRSFYFF